MKRYLSQFLLCERRSYSISYAETPFPCVPPHYTTDIHFDYQTAYKLNCFDILCHNIIGVIILYNAMKYINILYIGYRVNNSPSPPPPHPRLVLIPLFPNPLINYCNSHLLYACLFSLSRHV